MTTYMTDDLVPRWSTFTTDDELNPDSFIVFQDVDKTHSDMIDRYYILKNKTFTTDAEKAEMTQLEVNLQEYLPTSDTWNKLCACIRGMQMFMRDGIVVFVEQKQAEINKIISNYSEKGDWNATTTYSTGNFVRHGEFLFLSKVDNNLNHEPNNELSTDAYWLRFMIKGDKGDPSLNISIKKGTDGSGNYDNTITYNTGDACIYNHRLYYCVKDGTIGINPTDITCWKCGEKIWVGTDTPLDTTIVWWDTNIGENCFKRYSDNNVWVRQNVKSTDVPLVDVGNYFSNKNVESALQQVGSSTIYQTANGTSTVITLILPILVNGYSTTFIANGNNNGSTTTINGKNLYKPNTTIAPTLISGKAYTIWYSQTGDCFFIKASAEGTVLTSQVLAPYTFSNNNDVGLVGTIPSKTTQTYMPSTTDQIISSGQYLSGNQVIKGDLNLKAENILNGVNMFGITGTGGRRYASGTVDYYDQINTGVTFSFEPSIILVYMSGYWFRFIAKWSYAFYGWDETNSDSPHSAITKINQGFRLNSPMTVGYYAWE